MAIDNQEEFIGYILRKLGEPVVKVNLDEKSITDAVNDAIDKFCERHMDGSEEHFYVATVSAEDASSGYISIPKNAYIDSIQELLSCDGNKIGEWHTPAWQATSSMLSIRTGFSSIRLSDFVIMRQRLEDIGTVLGEKYPFTYKRYKNRVICHFEIKEGDKLAFRCYERIDPRVEGNEDAWNDDWLRRYATALVKERWGNVLVKAQGIKLPGGIELDGTSMLQEAKAEIDQCLQDLMKEHEWPVEFFVG